MKPSGITCIVLAALIGTTSAARDLSFDDRVRCQEALERVYYRHQLGAKIPFEQAVARSVIERKVRTYLKQCVALERFWFTPVSTQALRRELERMASRTRMGDRLAELFAALGNDPFLVQECLARPALVDRQVRTFFESDARLHETERKQADALREALVSGTVSPRAPHAMRTKVEFVRGSRRAQEDAPNASRVELPDAEFSEARSTFLVRRNKVEGVSEQRDAFTIDAILDVDADSIALARYRVPKRSWESWWGSVENLLPADSVQATADGSPLPRPAESAAHSRDDAQSRSCVPDDTWDNGGLDDVPEARAGHSAVWTGNVMIVWGGISSSLFAGGSRYDAATDTWSSMSAVDAPTPRLWNTGIWTGEELIVWGGWEGESSGVSQGSDTGARYNPVTDTWRPMAAGPTSRYLHSTVWTGSEMVVWGGQIPGVAMPPFSLNDGGRYDPASDVWRPVSLVGAPAGRQQHTAVWTGERMVLWGGWNLIDMFADGAAYDPVSDAWTALPSTNAPSPRANHTAVWTGRFVVVWGGSTHDGDFQSGARYEPATGRWSPTSTTNAPSARRGHVAVWTGQEMIVWGGRTFHTGFADGRRYDPSRDVWTRTSDVGAPNARANHSATWTGDRMIVWGGTAYDPNADTGVLASGARYDPTSDSWTPTSIGTGVPGRYLHQTVWTGGHMLVWGGYHDVVFQASPPPVLFRTPVLRGNRYDPAVDQWSPMTLGDSPIWRSEVSMIWTGSHAILWGGRSLSLQTYPAEGARYDPIADRWIPTSTVGAPAPRHSHTAVWTGTEMIVWGGRFPGGPTQTGGRYDPVQDRWAAVSTIDAPMPRNSHTAVWTGAEMIVWGGRSGTAIRNDGSRYDPAHDTWRPLPGESAPVPRYGNSGVWTGRHFVVWGGQDGSSVYLGSGGLYDPQSDTWQATASVDAPLPRTNHSAVWTGNSMLIWGGASDREPYSHDSGAGLDPEANQWLPMSLVGAPTRRAAHSAIWTGGSLLVWGGWNGSLSLPNPTMGGRYFLGSGLDRDGDGYSACDGDCNDGSASQSPTAVENCNGLDDNCDGIADEGLADVDGDAVADCRDNCGSVDNHDQSDWDGDGFGDTCESGTLLADIDHSGRVDGFDLVALGRSFGGSLLQPTRGPFRAEADLDRNEEVDGVDLSLLASEWGHVVTPP